MLSCVIHVGSLCFRGSVNSKRSAAIRSHSEALLLVIFACPFAVVSEFAIVRPDSASWSNVKVVAPSMQGDSDNNPSALRSNIEVLPNFSALTGGLALRNIIPGEDRRTVGGSAAVQKD